VGTGPEVRAEIVAEGVTGTITLVGTWAEEDRSEAVDARVRVPGVAVAGRERLGWDDALEL
jgi:hypothetical protein